MRGQEPGAPVARGNRCTRALGGSRGRSAPAFSRRARGASGLGAGSARAGSPRASGERREPGSWCRGTASRVFQVFPGRSSLGRHLALVSSCEAQARQSGRGGSERGGRGCGGGGRAFLFTSFPNSSLAPPRGGWRGAGAGRLGRLGLRDPCPLRPPPPCGWGWGRPGCPQVQTLSRGHRCAAGRPGGPGAPPPRVPKRSRARNAGLPPAASGSPEGSGLAPRRGGNSFKTSYTKKLSTVLKN